MDAAAAAVTAAGAVPVAAARAPAPAPARWSSRAEWVQAFDVALDLIRRLREPLATIAERDPALGQQLGRAAASVPLNLSEGRRRHGRDRLHLWRVAAVSADEVVAGLRVAEAWGHVDGPTIAPALALCDRVLAMLWRLTH